MRWAKQLLAFLGFSREKDGSLKELEPAALTMVPQLQGALLPVGADHVGPQADFGKQLRAAAGCDEWS